jgi:hypothetical protein
MIVYNKRKIEEKIMTEAEIKNIIQRELPNVIAEDPLIRDFILRTVSNYYAGKQETESKFDRILAELQRDREEQARKWDEQNQKWDEQNQKWDEQNRKWDENSKRLDKMEAQIDQSLAEIRESNQKWEEKWQESNQRIDQSLEEIKKTNERIDQSLEEIKKANRKYDSTIGALGSRWGLYSEASFRNALKGILEDSFGVEVINLNDFDQEGEVFGRPDQVEIDVIIKNGLVILCEIKSSISKAEIYVFDRKVSFYEKHYQKKVTRKLIISPMVDQRALPIAQNLGIEVFSYAEDVTF